MHSKLSGIATCLFLCCGSALITCSPKPPGPPPPQTIPPRLSIVEMDPPRPNVSTEYVAVDLTFVVQNIGTEAFASQSGEVSTCSSGAPTGAPGCPPLYSSSTPNNGPQISPLWQVQFTNFPEMMNSTVRVLVNGDLGQSNNVTCAQKPQSPQPSGHDALAAGCTETIHLTGVQATAVRSSALSLAAGSIQICSMQGSNGGACLKANMSQCPTGFDWCPIGNGGTCANLATDAAHCSACGIACASGDICVNKTCVPPVPLTHAGGVTRILSTGASGSGGTCSNPRLTYCGGPILAAPEIEIVFWGNGVQSGVQTAAVSFAQTLADSTYMSLFSQYNTQGLVGDGQCGSGSKGNQTFGQMQYNGRVTITPQYG